MTSFFSVLQFVPKVVADERINFGVVCFDDEGTRARVVSDWSRIARFCGHDVSFLKDFAGHLIEGSIIGRPDAVSDASAAYYRKDDIAKMASSWSHSIQLTTPRASILSASELLESVFVDYVVEQLSRDADARTRSEAKLDLVTRVRDALTQRISGDEARLRTLMRRQSIDGQAEKQRFDCIVGNGSPSFVAHAISFEAHTTSYVARTVEALAFRIEDVRRLHPELDFGVFALPPKSAGASSGNSSPYERADRIFASVGADLVPESKFDDWLAPLADRVVEHVQPA